MSLLHTLRAGTKAAITKFNGFSKAEKAAATFVGASAAVTGVATGHEIYKQTGRLDLSAMGAVSGFVTGGSLAFAGVGAAAGVVPARAVFAVGAAALVNQQGPSDGVPFAEVVNKNLETKNMEEFAERTFVGAGITSGR